MADRRPPRHVYRNREVSSEIQTGGRSDTSDGTVSWSSGFTSRNTQPRILSGFHHILTYSLRFGHDFAFDAIPNTIWSSEVGDENSSAPSSNVLVLGRGEYDEKER